MSILDELARLSEAHGSAAMAEAFWALQRSVRAARRQAKAQWGVLAQTYMAAMRIWDAEKRDGVSRPEREAHLEKTLRAAWPQTREWKYLCETCRDTGLELRQCVGDASCGRHREHLPHEYGVPCWCPAGAKFRPKPQTTEDELASVGKVGKPTRFGGGGRG